MHESVTYQMIVEEGIERGLAQGIERGFKVGEILGMRCLLIDVGTEKFGAPSMTIAAELERIASPDVLLRLGRIMMHSSSWDELMASL